VQAVHELAGHRAAAGLRAGVGGGRRQGRRVERTGWPKGMLEFQHATGADGGIVPAPCIAQERRHRQAPRRRRHSHLQSSPGAAAARCSASPGWSACRQTCCLQQGGGKGPWRRAGS
jgi:hypothetical protein